jgi:hypothetical protein
LQEDVQQLAFHAPVPLARLPCQAQGLLMNVTVGNMIALDPPAQPPLHVVGLLALLLALQPSISGDEETVCCTAIYSKVTTPWCTTGVLTNQQHDHDHIANSVTFEQYVQVKACSSSACAAPGVHREGNLRAPPFDVPPLPFPLPPALGPGADAVEGPMPSACRCHSQQVQHVHHVGSSTEVQTWKLVGCLETILWRQVLLCIPQAQ